MKNCNIHPILCMQHMHMCPSCVFGYCRDTEIRNCWRGKMDRGRAPGEQRGDVQLAPHEAEQPTTQGTSPVAGGLKHQINSSPSSLDPTLSYPPPKNGAHSEKRLRTRRSTAVFPVRKLVRRKHLRAASFHLRKLRSKKKKSSPFMKSAKRQWIWHPGIGKKGNLPQICDR